MPSSIRLVKPTSGCGNSAASALAVTVYPGLGDDARLARERVSVWERRGHAPLSWWRGVGGPRKMGLTYLTARQPRDAGESRYVYRPILGSFGMERPYVGWVPRPLGSVAPCAWRSQWAGLSACQGNASRASLARTKQSQPYTLLPAPLTPQPPLPRRKLGERGSLLRLTGLHDAATPRSLSPHPLSPQVGEGWRSRGEGSSLPSVAGQK